MPYLIKGQSALEKLGPLKLGAFYFIIFFFNECEWSGCGREKETGSEESMLKRRKRDRGKTYLPNFG